MAAGLSSLVHRTYLAMQPVNADWRLHSWQASWQAGWLVGWLGHRSGPICAGSTLQNIATCKCNQCFSWHKQRHAVATCLRDTALRRPVLPTPRVAYAPPEVRPGVLPRMLAELLATRVMVKGAMKRTPASDRVLQRVLNARQFGIKMISNVTYGYTSAGFSGRMPMAELADSIVQVGLRCGVVGLGMAVEGMLLWQWCWRTASCRWGCGAVSSSCCVVAVHMHLQAPRAALPCTHLVRPTNTQANTDAVLHLAVQAGRETLENAIRMVEAHPEWRAQVVYGDTGEGAGQTQADPAPLVGCWCCMTKGAAAPVTACLGTVLVCGLHGLRGCRAVTAAIADSCAAPAPAADSLFVHLPGRSREEAFHIGGEISAAVTAANPSPVMLKMEKVRGAGGGMRCVGCRTCGCYVVCRLKMRTRCCCVICRMVWGAQHAASSAGSQHMSSVAQAGKRCCLTHHALSNPACPPRRCTSHASCRPRSATWALPTRRRGRRCLPLTPRA